MTGTSGNHPYDVKFGMMDSDSYLDAVVTNYSDVTVSVLINNGSGLMALLNPNVSVAGPLGSFPADQPRGLALADVDVDGDLDVVTANYYSYINESSVSILLNDGSGSLTLARAVDFPAVSIALDAPIPTGEQAFNVAIADLNDDGAPDIVTSSEKEQTGGSRISVILANP